MLNGTATLFFAMAGLAFFFGGGLISAITQAERLLGEVEGMGLTVLLAAIGLIAKMVATRLEGDDGFVSLSDSLRK